MLKDLTSAVSFKGIECVHGVPYIHQGHINLCSDACVEMIRRFYGTPSDRKTTWNSKGVESLAENPRKMFKGYPENEVVDEIGWFKFPMLECWPQFNKD